jgi:dTDP-glucose 4,6-dehydratase
MKYFHPKNILVTGAAGFIGSNFVRKILECYANINIISYDKLTYAGNIDNLKYLPRKFQHTFVEGDICDSEAIEKTLRKYKIDTIVHFAAESHVDNSISNPGIFVQTNILGTYNLLEQARLYWQDEQGWHNSQCRFHHISTDEVYGTLSQNAPAFTETKAYEPNSPYAASKASSDHLVRAYFHTYGLPITISNCSNNYGPYQHPEKLIPMVIKNCIKYRAIPVYGDGSNIRDWLYVNDHCDAIDCIIRKGQLGEVYNIGGNREISNLNLIKTICKLLDNYNPDYAPHTNLITFVEDRKGHDWRYAIDNTKIRNELAWQPSQNFEQKLKQTIDFYLND